MGTALLKDIVTILGLSIGVLVGCHRFSIPPIVGFLITGMIAGPHGAGLAGSVEQIETLADVGVILLLFTIGVELSLGHLMKIRRQVLLGGFVQVGLTFMGSYFACRWFRLDDVEAAFVGFLVTLSSTAVVLRLLHERGELDTLHGRTAFGILIFQDLAIIPVMLLVPVLSDDAPLTSDALASVLLRAVLVLCLVFAAAMWAVPRLLHLIAKTRDSELFLVSVVVVCFSVAFITQQAGLSLALGALLAGLVISESEYSVTALSHILPFQQLFMTIFFVSVGMLLDIRFAFDNIGIVLGATFGVVLLKALLAYPVSLILGLPFRAGVVAALSVAQIGEFSFVVARSGVESEVLSTPTYQFFLSVSVLTLLVTPLFISYGPAIADLLSTIPMPQSVRKGWRRLNTTEHGARDKSGHTLVIGFGTNGDIVAHAAEVGGIDVIGIEHNPERVAHELRRGRNVVYGDAVHESELTNQAIAKARVVIVAVPDAVSTRRIIARARALSPAAWIIVRTRLMGEVNDLYGLGANEVIVEKFEAGMRIAYSLLKRYDIPNDVVEQFMTEVRHVEYEVLRRLQPPRQT